MYSVEQNALVLVVQIRLRIHYYRLRGTPERVPLCQLHQMIPVPAYRIDRNLHEVPEKQVRRHTQPLHRPHRRIVQGNLHNILLRPLGRVH